ncbi:MAG: DUF4272 domain-containing protein [Acidimicrobiales bacterium]|nr:DUF4272 domain-containing protein [Acidimicrobiales bacterium]MCB1249221.1 DUF4272 domain-containing protein [Acidimicrobiales bacterium]
MAAEPVSIFAARIDPAGVLGALARASARVVTDGGDEHWRRAEASFDAGGLEHAPVVLVHDSLRYRGPGWRTELALLREQVGSFPPSSQRSDVVRAVAGCRFVVSSDRGCLVDFERSDARSAAVLTVADQLDGLIVTPSGVRDPAGRVLVGANGGDRLARVPIGAATVPTGELLGSWASGDDGEPDAARVARRALALAAVSSRAFLEQMPTDAGDIELERVKLHAWVDSVDIADDLEPEEWRLLQTRVGSLNPSRAVDAAWRFEGLTVLAWALGRAEVPPDHQLVEATALFPSIGFLDYEASRRLVESARLRPIAEIEDLADRLAVLLEQLRGMRRRKRDQELTRTARAGYAAAFASAGLGRGAWEGPAMGELDQAPTTEADVAQVENIVLERLIAATWLLDGGTYSHTDV